MKNNLLGCAALCLLLVGCASVSGPVEQRQALQVQLAPGATMPTSGRLLVFARPLAAAKAAAKDGPVTKVDFDYFDLTGTSIAAREVARLAPGEDVEIDLDGKSFPDAFSKLPAGDYAVQAVLDVNHSYPYSGRGPGDLVSPVVEMRLPVEKNRRLVLETTEPDSDPWAPTRGPEKVRANVREAKASTEAIDFTSPSLSTFWGRPVAMRGWVVLPPGYAQDPKRRYPTVYYTHGFGGDQRSLVDVAGARYAAMRDGKAPPMIWVLLDQSTPNGTHEFADSVNQGPYQRALVQELIPELERRYRMDARASGRFLSGHSSGGWATLWLMVSRPTLFGGTWSTAPDPSDFHDFTGVDLLAGGNMYRSRDGALRPLVRYHGKVLGTLRDFTLLEDTLGNQGGQIRSFDWVFSPRGADGRALPMFDHRTGEIDPSVVAHWRSNYDVSSYLQKNWPRLKRDLDGKIHVAVGTDDTFYLDGAARRLQAAMEGLGAKTDFRYLPGKTHFDLYTIGDDRSALLNEFSWEMYAIARPKERRPARA
jgi:Putative esterase